jgi:hypothetical protein
MNSPTGYHIVAGDGSSDGIKLALRFIGVVLGQCVPPAAALVEMHAPVGV